MNEQLATTRAYSHRCATRARLSSPGLLLSVHTTLTLLLVAGSASGQNWIRHYSSAPHSAIFQGLAVDGSTRTAACGYVHSVPFIPGTEDGLVVVYASDGSLLWTKTFDGQGSGIDRFNAVLFDPAGYVYASGTSQGIDGRAYLVIVKYSPDGTLFWVYRTTTLTYDSEVSAGNLFLQPDGHLVACASARIAVTDPDITAFVIKVNATNMNEEWLRQRPGNGCLVKPDATGGVYFAGERRSCCGPNSTDVFVAKYTPSGALSWDNAYGSGQDNFDGARCLSVDSQGNAIIAGYRTPTSLSIDNDWLTMKIDPTGLLQWSAVFSVSQDDTATGLVVDSSDNIYVAGVVAASGRIVKYSPAGNQVWVRETTSSADGTHVGPTAIALEGVASQQMVLVIGNADNGFGGNTTTLMTLDGSGAELDNRSYLSTCPKTLFVSGLAALGDGDAILVGYAFSEGAVAKSGVVVRVDSVLRESRLYVNALAMLGGDGSSWQSAFSSLQEGLAFGSLVCEPGSEIWVAQGVYKATTCVDRRAAFRLAHGLAVYGGFVGDELSANERRPYQNETILDGNIGDPMLANDNSYHVVHSVHAQAEATVDGLIIANGFANGSGPPHSDGGAVYNAGGVLRVRACRMIGNHASRAGGGSFASGALARIYYENSAFSGNTSGTYGGALHVEESAIVDIANCTISSNSSVSHGGAVYCANQGVTTIENSILWDDSAPQGSEIRIIGGVVAVGSSDIAGGEIGITNSDGLLVWNGGNVDVDPQFANAVGSDKTAGTIDDDLHILTLSPCIDAGNSDVVSLFSSSTDIDGDARVHGCAVDLGFDEVAVGLPHSGDLSASGLVGVEDVQPFVNALVGEPTSWEQCIADVNADGEVDGRDIAVFISLLLMQ